MNSLFSETIEQLELAQKKIQLAQSLVDKLILGKTPREKLLTRRELQLIDHVCLGCNIKSAASIMGISEFTARTHVRNILGKLGVINMAAAIAVLAEYRPNLGSKKN